MGQKQHFAALDGLRGVAALAVVQFHSYGGGGGVANAELAVDLFFILSGFVIAYSYGERLPTMPRREFLLSRFIRLYPMLFVGALGGLAIGLFHNLHAPADARSVHEATVSGALSFLLLPYLGPGLGDNAFSFNPPMWSLFFEVIANVAYLLLARVLSIRVLVALVLASLVCVLAFGPLGGNHKATLFAGFPRVFAGFFGGVLLFELRKRGAIPRIPANFLGLSAAVLLMFALPVDLAGGLYPLAFVLLWLVVCAGAQCAPGVSDRWSSFLGTISYPIYLIHWLTLYLATFVGKRLGLTGDLYRVVAFAHLMAMPVLGYLVARFYETPARRALASALKPRRSIAAAA